MSVAEALAAVDATVGVTGTLHDVASLQATDGKQKEFVQRVLLRPPLVADDSCDGPAGVASAPGDDEESEVETEDEAAESPVAMIVPISANRGIRSELAGQGAIGVLSCAFRTLRAQYESWRHLSWRASI
jgi:hypothetical protein